MIEVQHLTKKYDNLYAVNDISFTIESGKIYGFLGPNGAGKSTTMNIITGCLSATSGTVSVDGKDIFENPIEAKRKIGYLPEIPPLYTEMTPAEYLAFVAQAKGVGYEQASRQIKEVMELTQITYVADRLIRNLSKGYRQRVGIAQALLGNPDIIILDEPTVGLDPKQIIEIRDLIRLLGQNKTVIVSSHILAEISEVCDHVIILSHGRLVANDSLSALEAGTKADTRLQLTVKGEMQTVASVLTEIEGVCNIDAQQEHENGICSFLFDIDFQNDPRDIIFYTLADKKIPIVEMSIKRPTLEDIFLRLTSNAFVNEENEQFSNQPSFENDTACDFSECESPEQQNEQIDKEDIDE